MVDFMAQIDRHGNRWTRRASPKVVKLKPYLNLDMSSATAAKMARMTLRAYRPFVGRAADPMLIQDDSVAVEELEVFIRSSACPRHLVERYQQHNRRRGQKRERNKEEATKAACGDATRRRMSCDRPSVVIDEQQPYQRRDPQTRSKRQTEVAA